MKPRIRTKKGEEQQYREIGKDTKIKSAVAKPRQTERW